MNRREKRKLYKQAAMQAENYKRPDPLMTAIMLERKALEFYKEASLRYSNGEHADAYDGFRDSSKLYTSASLDALSSDNLRGAVRYLIGSRNSLYQIIKMLNDIPDERRVFLSRIFKLDLPQEMMETNKKLAKAIRHEAARRKLGLKHR